MSSLVRRFNEFGAWRDSVSCALRDYREWLAGQQLLTPSLETALQHAVERLNNEKLSVAFVAEFSRGKTELINAIFFAEYGERVLPSSAGRTTMCPTELLWEPGTQPSIRLLPIETRAEQTSLSTLREDAGAWIEVPLETHDRDSMLQGLARVADTKRVPLTTARLFGLYDEFDPDHAAQVGHDGQIEISCWRHAIINFPHPLLKQGLVVIDTPGLNAIGSEPELTINLIPNADVVLFVLAADTGVTRSDLDTWQRHIGGATRHGRFVLLNKIDTMWDELKSTDEIEAEIDKQIEHSAELLGVDRDQMFALSAQKGLVGKIHHDAPLLARSRLLTLENAISERLVPQRRRIVAEQLAHDVDGVMREIQGMLVGRTRGVVEQIYELNSVRGKNTSSVERMLDRIQHEKEEFETTMRQLIAVRSVFARLSNDLYRALGTDTLRAIIADTRGAMSESRFSPKLKTAMRDFLDRVRNQLDLAQAPATELEQLMTAMYKRFAAEHAMQFPPAYGLRVKAYREDVDKIDALFQREFSTIKLLTQDHGMLVQRFYETIASRVKHTFALANKDVELWLKSLMSPIESQTREHQRQLRKRLETVKRVHEASDQLDTRISELQEQQDEVEALVSEHSALIAQMRSHIFALAMEVEANKEDAEAAEAALLPLAAAGVEPRTERAA